MHLVLNPSKLEFVKNVLETRMKTTPFNKGRIALKQEQDKRK